MRANGFSLIELMIVIGVITLINIVMVPNFNRLQQSAKLQSAKSTARGLLIALEQYYFITQRYPDGENLPISEILPELKTHGLITSDPINPYTGDVYSFQDSSGKLIYSLSSQNQYQLVGYGINNTDIIFKFP